MLAFDTAISERLEMAGAVWLRSQPATVRRSRPVRQRVPRRNVLKTETLPPTRLRRELLIQIGPMLSNKRILRFDPNYAEIISVMAFGRLQASSTGKHG